MVQNVNGKNVEWKNSRMVQNVEWKNAEGDKTSNEKRSNGTKSRIENRKEKYIINWINCNPWISCVRLVHDDFAW
jgi:hypothetical protein